MNTRNKKLSTTFKKLVLTLVIAVTMLQIVDAYVYNGYKWSSGVAEWRFSTDFPDNYEQSVRNAANTWSNAGSSFRFSYVWWEITSKVDWTDLGYYGPLGNTGVASSGSSILWVVTDINSAKYWTTTQSQDYPPYDIETAALHEFGHWLSLGHSSYTNAVMYEEYDGPKRSLAQDDTNGIKYIYP